MKKLYLKDIAKSLGLSKTTVSFVLNDKGDANKINKDTQKRILDFAKKYNYKPNQLARSLSRGKTETIGLIIPNISDIFYARIAGCIEAKAKEYGYTVVFSSSNESKISEGKLIESMRNRQVDGLIIASTQKNEKNIELLKLQEFPFVLIDRHYPKIDTNFVIVNNFEAVKKATNHLFDLGNKRIAFVSINSDLDAMKQRMLGYKEACNGKGVSFLTRELSQGNYKEQMPLVITKLCSGKQPIDAILFATHYLASEGIRALKNKQIEIPAKVALISFDELNAFDLVDPPITSIIQPVEMIGNTAVQILMDTINNKSFTTFQHTLLDTEFKIRKSCGS